MATKPIESLSTDDAATIREALLIGDRNAADGFAGLNSDGHLVGTFRQRVGTDAEINEIVLASGELAYTTDTLEVRIGDGSTAGGIFLFAKPIITGGRLGPLTSTYTTYGAIATKEGALYRSRGFIRLVTTGVTVGPNLPTGQSIIGTGLSTISFGGMRNVTNNTVSSAATGVLSSGGFGTATLAAAGDYYFEAVGRSSGGASGASISASHPSSTGNVFDVFYLEVQRIA